MLGFTLKKWLGAMLQPLPLLVVLFSYSLLLMVRGKKRLAVAIQCVALFLLILVATPPFANYSIKQIEGQIAQFDPATPVDYVVVLGCGHINDRRIPITSQVNSCSLHRATEGIRLAIMQPSTKLIFTGYGRNQPISNAETNKELAIALGFPESRIITYSTPKDTREEAQVLTPILSNKSFALVTEASHMPRAIQYFQQQGLNPIPAPTAHLFRQEGTSTFEQYFPDAHYLHKTERAIYEALGQLWQYLTS